MVDGTKIFVFTACVATLTLAQDAPSSRSRDLAAPVRLTAGTEPIDIGKLSAYAHAGPVVFDVDGDGRRDLVVGDFPGNFWLFRNAGTEAHPVYEAGRKLTAGGADAKVPVY